MSTQYITPPPTSIYTVVFPFDNKGDKFDSGFYFPNLTDGRASAEEISQVLEEINRTRKPIISQIFMTFFCFFLVFTLCIASFLFFMIGFGSNDSGFTPAVIIIAFICGIAGTFVIFITRAVRLDKRMKAQCQEIVDKTNQSFASKGLRWYLPIHFPRWVELWKDYQGHVGNQPYYVPPVVNQQRFMDYPPQAQNNNIYANL